VYARTKSYFDTNAEEWATTATETQGDPSKGAEDEETARTFRIECYKKELEQCSRDMKWLTARETFKAKTRSYEIFSEQYVQEVLEDLSSHQETSIPIVHHWAGGSGKNWNARCTLSITKDLHLFSR
jgi:hypothetical protein